VETLTQQITMLHENRGLLDGLRAASLKFAPEVTWTAAGAILLDVYRETLQDTPPKVRRGHSAARSKLA